MSVTSELPLAIAQTGLAIHLQLLIDGRCNGLLLRIPSGGLLGWPGTPPPRKSRTKWRKYFMTGLKFAISAGRHNGAIHRILARKLPTILLLILVLLLLLLLCWAGTVSGRAPLQTTRDSTGG